MPDNIISTQGDVIANTPGTRTQTPLGYPAGLQVFQSRRMSGVYYRRTAYLHGKYSRGLVRFEGSADLFATGIEAPPAPSAATDGAGAVVGQVIYYVEARHKIAGEIVHRSNLSSGSNTVTAASNDILVNLPVETDIPSPDDERVTDLGIYRSTDGGLPRFVAEVTLGTATYLDNATTGSLGSTPPLTSSGLAVANRRGIPPYGRWVRKWHNRLWISGIPDQPYRTFYSEVDEFESFGTDNYIDTREGESTSGLAPCEDQLLFFCFTCTYEVTGYRASDFVIRKSHPSLGCISHFSIVNYDDNKREKLLWASQRGVVQYDGGYKFVMEDMERYWKEDFEANREAYMNSQATEDWEEHWYKLLVITPKRLVGSELVDDVETPVEVTVNSWYYIGHYLRWHPSFVGGDPQMMWSLKLRARKDSAIGYLVDDEGTRVNYAMGCDGYIRRENIPWDDDDDGDLLRKRLRVKSGHIYARTPGGDVMDGALLDTFWLHLQAEEDAVFLSLWGGEDQAAEPNADGVQPPAHWEEEFQPGEATDGGQAFVPAIRRYTVPTVPGPGHTWETLVHAPRGVRISGWGAVYVKGVDQRGETTPTT